MNRVDFIPASGASFDEMFVGVGASRVRALFEQARRAVGGKAVILLMKLMPWREREAASLMIQVVKL